MRSLRRLALPVPVRVTALCTIVLALHAGASGTVFAATPSPLDGWRLFFTPEQRSRARADDSQASPAPASPVTGSDSAVAPSAGPAGSIGAADAQAAIGRATVRGQRGVQRIEHGVPHRAIDPRGAR